MNKITIIELFNEAPTLASCEIQTHDTCGLAKKPGTSVRTDNTLHGAIALPRVTTVLQPVAER